MAHKIKFKPDGSIVRSFMRDSSFVRGIRGPVGSSKSSACVIEILRRAYQQEPGQDGVRRTRAIVVRNTNPELKTTTIKTWLDWVPENVFGRFHWQPPFTHHIKVDDIDLEVIFLALDRPQDVKKLLSLESTMIWVNEAREIDKAVVDGCTMRVGRYPPMKDGGPTWYGVIMDTNAMEPDHWWPLVAGDAPIPDELPPEDVAMLVKPDNWKFFNQPEAMHEEQDDKGSVIGYKINQKAENINYLPPDYYTNMIRGKTRSWINLYVRNRLGSAQEGKLVYPQFREEVHVAEEKITPIPHIPVHVGIDFGLTPAAVIGQRLRGRWIILHEICAHDMGAARFAEQLKIDLQRLVPNYEVSMWGDPAGDSRAQTDEKTPFQIFRAAGLSILPAPGNNDFILRTEAVNGSLNRMVDGKPSFLLSPHCLVLKAGFNRGYCYPRIQVSGAVRYGDRPIKNRYSHPHDALQYLLLGAGEGYNVITPHKSQQAKPVVAAHSFSPFDRAKKSLFSRRRGTPTHL